MKVCSVRTRLFFAHADYEIKMLMDKENGIKNIEREESQKQISTQQI